MPHFLDENVSVLRRWAAVSDTPMPSDWKEFQSQNAGAAISLEQQDPELVQLLSGTASAALKADALTGKLPHTAPDPQTIALEQFEQQLTQARAKVQSGEAGLFERIWLEENDPQASKAPEAMPHFTGPMASARRSNWIHSQTIGDPSSQSRHLELERRIAQRRNHADRMSGKWVNG